MKMEINFLSSYSLPASFFFLKDFPYMFMASLLGLVGKSMQTSLRTTLLLMSTDKGMLYKELYKSCTSFQSPKVGLTEEPSLYKSTLNFFSTCDILLPFPTSPFYLKSVLTLPLTGVSWICAMLHTLPFLEMTEKLYWPLSNPFKSFYGRKALPSFCSQCCLCGFAVFFNI